MMEPITLAATAVSLLTPYLEKIAKGVMDDAVDAVADKAFPALKRLYEALKAKLRPGTYGGTQLQGVEERPGSEGRQKALETAMVEEFERDPEFAALVEGLVADARAASGIHLEATDTGIAATGSVTITGGQDAVGRDKITYAPPPPPER